LLLSGGLVHPRIDLQDLSLDRLADVIRDEGAPLPLPVLIREAIRSYLTTDNGMPVFAPGSNYAPGTRLRFNGFVGNVVSVESGENAVQGGFKILTLKLKEGEEVRVAAEIDQAPTSTSPEMISEHVVDRICELQKVSLLRQVRHVLSADPRFVMLYHQGQEYGCLRELFPPMSPDVLDAALAVLLDSLFERGQIPIHQLTAAPGDRRIRDSVVLGNGALFSDRYLRRALRRDADWHTDLTPIYDTLRALWMRARDHGRNWDDQRTETALVQPLLAALGWSSVPLSALDPGHPDSAPVPEQQILCRDPAACAALYVHPGTLRSASGQALAIAQTAPWSDSLDGSSSSDSAWWHSQDGTDAALSIPSYQMVQTLTAHEVSWGILTNGRQWRLFTRRANSIITEFHELDLDPVFDCLSSGHSLTTAHWTLLREWWMLFRRDAFVIRDRGRSFLDQLYESAPARRRERRAYLRRLMIHDVLPALVGGFVAYRHRRRGGSEEDAASLRLIKRASLSLLTRILFLVVAEARFLLPSDDPDYHAHSLTSLLSWAEACAQGDIPPNPGLYTTPRYDLLLALLHRINAGDASKSLPEYGPVFFDPTIEPAHAFVAEHRLSDAVLAEVLTVLRREIDGTSFGAYELGAVLEPLLDVDVRVVDAARGEIAVVDDSASSSHVFTGVPDYVAKDVVAHALTPLLEQRGEQFVQAMDRVVSLRRKLQRTLDPSGRADLQGALATASHQACETFLSLRIVDPSMRTGVFLLSALDVITDGVIEQIQTYHDTHPQVPWRWNPMQRLFNRVRHDIASELRRQGIEVQDRALNDVSVMRRLIAQHCLYGVDPDPIAVDLAQIGLWLRSFMAGAPFIFLKHRIRVGDSLAGTDLDALRKFSPPSLDLAAMFDDASMMYSVIDRINTSSLDVRWSMKQFARVEQVVHPYRHYFTLNVQAACGDQDAQALLDHLAPSLLPALQGEKAWDEETEADLNHIVPAGSDFHWPLMFLDAFVDFEHRAWADEPGFDAVIGQVPRASKPAPDRIVQLTSDSEGHPSEDPPPDFVRMAHRLTRQRNGKTSCVVTRESLAAVQALDPLMTSRVRV